MDLNNQTFDLSGDEGQEKLREIVATLLEQAPEELESPDPETPEGRIFQAATELFASQGLEGTSTRAIAEQAGVNLAMIHYYFSSKEKLYRRCVSNAIRTIFKSMARDHMGRITPEEFLLDYTVRILGVLRSNEIHSRLLQREIAGGGNQMRDIITEMGQYGPMGFQKLFTMLYEVGVKRGKLRPYPPMEVLRGMISMAFGMFMAQPFTKVVTGMDFDNDQDWNSQMATLSAMIRHGLSTEEPA